MAHVFIACCITESKERWAVTQECSPWKMDLLKTGSAPLPPCGELIKQREDLWELFLSFQYYVCLNQLWVRNRQLTLKSEYSLKRYCFGYFTWMNQTLIAQTLVLLHNIQRMAKLGHSIALKHETPNTNGKPQSLLSWYAKIGQLQIHVLVITIF